MRNTYIRNDICDHRVNKRRTIIFKKVNKYMTHIKKKKLIFFFNNRHRSFSKGLDNVHFTIVSNINV